MFRRVKHKFNAKKVELDGRKFASKLESKFYSNLNLRKKSGEIVFFLEQVPIRLPGGTKYVVDFMIFYDDGNIRFIDVKGVETDAFKIKKREVEAIYPFEIEIIKKGDF